MVADIERTVIVTGVAVWFAHAWYMNHKLAEVHKKLDSVLANLNGLRLYLYEIDPQFDDERLADDWTTDDEALTAGAAQMELLREKRATGRRTLNTRFDEDDR